MAGHIIVRRTLRLIEVIERIEDNKVVKSEILKTYETQLLNEENYYNRINIRQVGFYED